MWSTFRLLGKDPCCWSIKFLPVLKSSLQVWTIENSSPGSIMFVHFRARMCKYTLFFPIKTIFLCLREWQKNKGRKSKREYLLSCWLTPQWPQQPEVKLTKANSRNSTQVSHMIGYDPSTGTVIWCIPGVLAGAGSESEVRLHTQVECTHPEWHISLSPGQLLCQSALL